MVEVDGRAGPGGETRHRGERAVVELDQRDQRDEVPEQIPEQRRPHRTRSRHNSSLRPRHASLFARTGCGRRTSDTRRDAAPAATKERRCSPERRTTRRASPGIPAPSERDRKAGPCTRRRHGRHEVVLAFDSGQAPLRHTRLPAESCFLPDLTRFTGSRCAGPDPQRLVRVVPCRGPSLGRGFSPPYVGLG